MPPMDIATTIVGAGTKALAGVLTSGKRIGVASVGSREDLRAVYLDYGQACTHYVLAVGWMHELGASDPKNQWKLADTAITSLAAAASMMSLAHVAVRMSASPEVQRQARELGDATMALGNGDAVLGAPKREALHKTFVDTMDAYLLLCRVELRYRPRWWEPHRSIPRWWKDRSARKEAEQLLRRDPAGQ
ncbi:hypothetical protein [Kitasatospora sp. NPDC059327]|uniref:hypothetical protein n=1 Tax=Kitasatospora sp. NPDC059327 TaxID=3346803 RepID=UPI003683A761